MNNFTFKKFSLLILVLIALFIWAQNKGGRLEPNEAKSGETVIKNIKLQDDFTGAKVAKEDLLQGCLGKDCIKSIDEPKFETTTQANAWLKDDDRVFAINYDGVARAYPQRIMNWHEIVNDEVNGVPIMVTFCPLCGSALAFKREVNGVITEFGVSGKLHESDLVMYDRYEGNLWQQITGEAIVGPAARRNETLVRIPVTTVSWNQWRDEHPDAQVLSLATGFSRNYDQPYGTYEQNDQLLFGVKDLNKSLPIKTVVYGVEINGLSKAYPEDVFDNNPQLNDVVAGVPIVLEKQADGEILVRESESGEEIIPLRLFWFAWAAFHPETELYKK